MADLLLPNLLAGNCSDRVCVRVSRLWNFYDTNNETKLLHANMVLIDEEGNSIHAQVYPPADELFRTRIKEGGVYTFSYFRVRGSNICYKPVENDQMLVFTKWTKVEEVLAVPPAFPMYAYSIASPEQLQARIDTRTQFTDVIGVITAISSIGTTQTKLRQGSSTKRTVTIQTPSNILLDVVLWSERATAFPADEVHKDGQTSPQVVLFVGTLVKSFGGMSLSGSSPCKWYINPDIPDTRKLLPSAKPGYKPIVWSEGSSAAVQKEPAQEKKISEILDLNPFEYQKTEFIVTVTARKIGSNWWYNACKKCMKTAKRHGDSYKCTGPKCNYIGIPNQRFKLSILAGDNTADAEFILFGRQAQRLTRKSADTLVAENPADFIPDELTKLLEKTFTWIVSFTDSTTDSGTITLQVNTVVGEVGQGGSIIPAMPATSQTSSLMLSEGATTSMHGTSHQGASQQSQALPMSPIAACSDASHASNASPVRPALPASDAPQTPQSVKSTANNKDKSENPAMKPSKSALVPQKPFTRKRSRPTSKANVAKKLLIDDEAEEDDGGSSGGAPSADQQSPTKEA